MTAICLRRTTLGYPASASALSILPITAPQKLSQSYWDNLSKVWLTKNAIKELDRRKIPSRAIAKAS
ncbi:uncharacterized protein BDCG_17146 [Blastomyces dermatitidis ER-3]|uniref:Uncharacterized protein n=2 Tax=Ajellomyces dermatitidis TaxID=5039 RepID=A0A0J9EQE3_AJEDA|nr:uncharacterized protein BDCG_17146 [Blastomyces dermatitidis ER-3]EQL32083.1 hypothetical protein BDFG_05669 [Blastomyces dermatitidis ATCC 26199]KMW68231.1 hypothetical protein BDDG_12672 [Blastomyces dermatitidis ATCC 18188]OAT01581.1 hypothetical protein BDCG_17146 [Blastomyces dermatitidis ER-3]